MLKVVIEKILPDNMEKILFLDTDLLFLQDISELWLQFERMSSDQCFGIVGEQSGMYILLATQGS